MSVMSQQSMWPDGRESAACFTFDLDGEEVWIADLQAAGRPGVLSQGTYGPKVAVPLILDILRRHQVAATFFVPGRVAERHPRAVRAILADGHEIGHHGYTHRSPAGLSAAEEESELVLGRRALEQFGAELRGHRAPSWDTSERTLGLLAEHGFSYASNLMDDIRLTAWTFHPQVIGRPGRLPLLDELIAAAVADSSVWVARADEIARVAALHQAGPDRARSGRTS
jgi:peptidoglycan-N-acetylglucosamine deacetylase